MNYLFILQIIHIVCGSIWLGGFLFVYLVLLPSLVKRNHLESIQLLNDIKKPATTVLGIAGVISILLGLMRGILWGNVNSINSLFTPYGRNFITAILLTVVMILFGKVYDHNLDSMIWEKGVVKKNALLKIYSGGIIFLFLYAMLIFCMVAMRSGGI